MAASRVCSVPTLFVSSTHTPSADRKFQSFRSIRFNPPSIRVSRSRFSCAAVVVPRLVRVHGLVGDESVDAPEPESDNSERGATIDLNLPRRSLLVQFTCNSCGERTERLVNRLAFERGAIFVQDVYSITN
ncbi:uncharacterized protein LOC130739619 isoform X2 [Lotus japonicus]|uniref:uncharacterized protein LOC130739619 isoform X2 n=1 Tax=Lotus japonicus TaxID=34305 RepID=UPI00258F0BC3|nr:uncharacterized protein LOC130739619 isoform X2 [Lotus japonicus]